MALSNQNAYLEVRSTGSDTNGGGFSPDSVTYSITNLTVTTGGDARIANPVVKSASYNFTAGDVGHYLYIGAGTNWRYGLYRIIAVASNEATLERACASVQQPTLGSATINYTSSDTPKVAVTDGALNAGSATLTCATSTPFTPAMVGNHVYLAGGTGTQTGIWCQIKSYTSSSVVTLQNSTGIVTGTGVTVNLGGALLTPDTAITIKANGNAVFLKSGTYLRTTTLADNKSSSAPAVDLWCGFANHYDDQCIGGTRPIIRASSAITGNWLFTHTNSSSAIRNIEFDGASQAATYGVSGGNCYLHNCYIHHCTGAGVSVSAMTNCLVDTVNTNAALNLWAVIASEINYCKIVNTGASGVYAPIQAARLHKSIVANCAGSSNNNYGAVYPTGAFWFYDGNLFYNNTYEAVVAAYASGTLRNNIFHTCVTGFYDRLNKGARFEYDGNAYYNCTTNKSQYAYGGPQGDGVMPPLTSRDIFLTSDPLVDAVGGDFRINATAGGGALLRGTGWGTPGLIDAAQAGYNDFGPLQALSSPTVQVIGRGGQIIRGAE